jgi:hypothetical protein
VTRASNVVDPRCEALNDDGVTHTHEIPSWFIVTLVFLISDRKINQNKDITKYCYSNN